MRVRRRRGIHVLMGTLALVAGCSTSQRAEVSGTVRDRATGRVIAGARVVGADGSLAETDADGRFHLYVLGEHADVRISAAGHSSEHLEIEGLEALVELAPLDTRWGETESDAVHVLSFEEETWTLDAGASDAHASAPCTETSLAQAHSSAGCAGCHESERATSSCATCHASESARVAAGDRVGAHEALSGGCLACHGEITRGDASASCARCHGAEGSTLHAEVGRWFARATSAAREGTTFEMRSTLDATWAEALARDRSRGAHDPRGLREMTE